MKNKTRELSVAWVVTLVALLSAITGFMVAVKIIKEAPPKTEYVESSVYYYDGKRLKDCALLEEGEHPPCSQPGRIVLEEDRI